MAVKLIGRGVLAGALAGLLCFLFARVFAEPVIQQAISYETARDAAVDTLHGVTSGEGAEVYSRGVQANLGAGIGLVLFGVAMGALVAVGFAATTGRLGAFRARTLSLLVAGAGFLVFFLMPFLKYPSNPPAIGHAETIGARSGLYLAMVVATAVVLALAVVLGRRLAPALGAWNATLVAGLAGVVVMGVVMLVLPAVGHLAVNEATYGDFATETPQPLTDAGGAIVFPGFPADVLAQFRLYSVLNQAILWGVIGLVFGALASRVMGAADAQPLREDEPALR